MKILAIIVLVLIFLALVRNAFARDDVPQITPIAAAARVKADTAILVDVREPSEWQQGVAAPAYLLPMSDLHGDRRKWAHVLETAKKEKKEILLYCRSGNRSGQAAALLAKEGLATANVGGFDEWQAAELPVRSPDSPAGNE